MGRRGQGLAIGGCHGPPRGNFQGAVCCAHHSSCPLPHDPVKSRTGKETMVGTAHPTEIGFVLWRTTDVYSSLEARSSSPWSRTADKVCLQTASRVDSCARPSRRYDTTGHLISGPSCCFQTTCTACGHCPKMTATSLPAGHASRSGSRNSGPRQAIGRHLSRQAVGNAGNAAYGRGGSGSTGFAMRTTSSVTSITSTTIQSSMALPDVRMPGHIRASAGGSGRGTTVRIGFAIAAAALFGRRTSHPSRQ